MSAARRVVGTRIARRTLRSTHRASGRHRAVSAHRRTGTGVRVGRLTGRGSRGSRGERARSRGVAASAKRETTADGSDCDPVVGIPASHGRAAAQRAAATVAESGTAGSHLDFAAGRSGAGRCAGRADSHTGRIGFVAHLIIRRGGGRDSHTDTRQCARGARPRLVRPAGCLSGRLLRCDPTGRVDRLSW